MCDLLDCVRAVETHVRRESGSSLGVFAGVRAHRLGGFVHAQSLRVDSRRRVPNVMSRSG